MTRTIIQANCMQIAKQWSRITMLVVAVVITAAPVAMSAAIAQGFSSSDDLIPGTLAALKSNQGKDVVAADTSHTDGIVGVVVATNDATISLNSSNTVQVATSGTAKVFVTDIAGAIKAGDKITASPIVGVGMKATDSTKIVGVAEADFDTSQDTRETTVTTKDGKSQKVSVGSIPIQVQVSYYAVPKEKTIIPTFLQQFSNGITGKQVSPVRIIIGTLIIIGAVITASTLLFSAVRSSILSIGRNPLARNDIYKGLFQVLFTSVVILAMGVGSTYLILRY